VPVTCIQSNVRRISDVQRAEKDKLVQVYSTFLCGVGNFGQVSLLAAYFYKMK